MERLHEITNKKESVKHTLHTKIVYKFKGRVCIPSASTILFG